MVIEEIISVDDGARGIKPKRFCIYRNGEYVTFKIIAGEQYIKKDLCQSQAIKVFVAWQEHCPHLVSCTESPTLTIDFPPDLGKEWGSGEIQLFSDDVENLPDGSLTLKFSLTGYNATLVFTWLKRYTGEIIERDFQKAIVSISRWFD